MRLIVVVFTGGTISMTASLFKSVHLTEKVIETNGKLLVETIGSIVSNGNVENPCCLAASHTASAITRVISAGPIGSSSSAV